MLLLFQFSDGPANLWGPTADSKNPESAVWLSRQCFPVLGPFLSHIPQSGLIAGSPECSPSSSMEGFPWWISPLQAKDIPQVCDYLDQQQSYAMPLIDLMTSNNPKMDWCNTFYLNLSTIMWLLTLLIVLFLLFATYIYYCVAGFVSSYMKAFKLQTLFRLLQVPQPFFQLLLGAPGSENLNMRVRRICCLNNLRTTPLTISEAVMEWECHPFPLAT